ncbi:MAG: ThiF family adenylyltransferase [Planctomycetota bacterium]|nr:ThiF family adenylyltransferase [Planctomycetota bacterium]
MNDEAHPSDSAAPPRYSRQVLLPFIGEEGQRRLTGSHALLVGCGALGCAVADALARAGVGRLTIVDRDFVDVTNLQRQSLFDESDAREGLPKSVAAERRLGAVNSAVRVRGIVEDLSARNAEGLLEGDAGGDRPDVIIDGTDNFETRYLLNDLAVKRGAPFVYGGVVAAEGMQMTVVPRGEDGTACLRCVFPDPPAPGSAATCDTAGVLGPAVAMVAAMQATEAIKILVGRKDLLHGGLVRIDLETNRFDVSSLASAKDPACPCCGARRFEFLDASASSGTTVLCGRDSVQVTPAGGNGAGIDLAAAARRLAAHGEFRANAHMVRGAFREVKGEGGRGVGLALFPTGRAIITGVTSAEAARSIYARFIGS